MYLQPLQTDPLSPSHAQTHTQQITPSPSTPTASTSPQIRPPGYDPIDPSSSHTLYQSTKQPTQQHTPADDHNADDQQYNDEHYDDGEGGGEIGEDGNYTKRNRIRTRVDPTPCKLCGRSYRYRKPHFMRYHPEWAGATDFEVERGGSSQILSHNGVAGLQNAVTQIHRSPQLHHGQLPHATASSPRLGPVGSVQPAINGLMTLTPQGKDMGMRRALLDSARERGEGEIGRVIRRTAGPSLPLSSPAMDYGAFTAVNVPGRSDTEHTDEEKEREGERDRAERYLRKVYASRNGIERDARELVTPPRSNDVQESRKRDLDSLMNPQSDGAAYKRIRGEDRHEDEVHVHEPKAQWEKMLDAIRAAPELNAAQKRGLVYDLFKEHIKAAGRESSMSMPSVERQLSMEDTRVLTLPVADEKRNGVAEKLQMHL